MSQCEGVAGKIRAGAGARLKQIVAVAKANGVALYPFFLDGVAAQPSLQLADGMHPNGKGVAVMVKRILPAVEQELAKAK
jgi:acyl-CoA thioesterase-1